MSIFKYSAYYKDFISSVTCIKIQQMKESAEENEH